ncbi:MAG: RDD family protein [Oscillospiraceae bacterium]|nr:RDD family protein [Oscillospiraceae bacterium]
MNNLNESLALRRLAAFMADWYLSSFFAMLPVIVCQSIRGGNLVLVNRIDTLPFALEALCAALAVAIWTCYFCIIPLRRHGGFAVGQTPGRRLFRIALAADGEKLSFRTLFVRDFVGILLLQGNTTSVNVYLLSLAETLIGNADFLPYVQSFYYIVLAVSTVLLLTKGHRNLQERLSGTHMQLAECDPCDALRPDCGAE